MTDKANDALMRAVYNADLEAAEKAIKDGADVKYVTLSGGTMLHWAAHTGYSDMCKLLLDNGASLDALDNDKFTPFQVAAYSNHLHVCKVMLEYGADIESLRTIKNDDNVASILRGLECAEKEVPR